MNKRLPWMVFFLSAALLGFQLVLMRMLSYSYWHHYATMVISLALLGFGAAGTFLTVARGFVVKNLALSLVLFSLLCVLGIAAAPWLCSLIPADPYLLVWEPARILSLFALVIAFLLPIFCGATVIGISFILHPERTGILYFANLIGSGAGILLAVVLMSRLEPAALSSAVALIAAPSPLIASSMLEHRRKYGIAGCLLLSGTLLFLPPPSLPLSQFKSLSRTLLFPDARPTGKAVSPLGVVETVESEALRYAPGMSLNYRGSIPSMTGAFVDGEWAGAVIDPRDSTALAFLRYSTLSFPYCLQRYPRALVIGAGTGTELRFAAMQGTSSVTGIEQNAALLELVARRDDLEMENTTMVVAEARSFLSQEQTPFDLIIVPILEGFASSSSGAHALFENYLFTVESFRLIIRRLAENGVLVVHGWNTAPPRGSLKTVALLIEALRQEGIDPRSSLAGIRSWGTFSLLAKKNTLSAQEQEAIRAYADERAFDLFVLPDLRPEEANRFHQLERPLLFEGTLQLLGDQRVQFLDSYLFDVRPPTDDRPYFSHFIRWKHLPRLSEFYTSGQIAFFELGFVLLFVSFLPLLLLGLVFIIFPLVRVRASLSPSLWASTLLYFGGIGIGYMMIEILLIQKFILFLGHPVYSVSLVITALLLFSGLGSFSSGFLRHRIHLSLSRAVLAVLLIALFHAVALPLILPMLFSLDFFLRAVSAVLLIAPLGFVMGLPFPLGLQRTAAVSEPLVPWGWSVNGYSSVIGASFSSVLSMEFGFLWVSLGALFFYACALVSMRIGRPH